MIELPLQIEQQGRLVSESNLQIYPFIGEARITSRPYYQICRGGWNHGTRAHPLQGRLVVEPPLQKKPLLLKIIFVVVSNKWYQIPQSKTLKILGLDLAMPSNKQYQSSWSKTYKISRVKHHSQFNSLVGNQLSCWALQLAQETEKAVGGIGI